jgi:hypothetical protein
MEILNPPAVIGEAIAGQANKVLNEIQNLIAGVNTSTFDLAELLHEAKTKQYYLALGHDTFGSYAKSLDLKVSKSYYLCRIVENMQAAGLTREQYEPLGIAKLRVISKVDLIEDDKPVMYNDLPMTEYIKELVTTAAANMSLEEVEQVVDKLQGKIGDDAMVWLNISMKKAARDQTVLPAIEVAKLHLGTPGTDDDGKAKDASDGRALEAICADFMSDPNNNPQS